MCNDNLYKRVTGRGRGIMSATPLNLRQKRLNPVLVLSSIKIEAGVETSNARMPRGDNSKHASAKATKSSLEFMLKSFEQAQRLALPHYHSGQEIKERRKRPKPVSVPSTIKIEADIEHRILKMSHENNCKMLVPRPLVSH